MSCLDFQFSYKDDLSKLYAFLIILFSHAGMVKGFISSMGPWPRLYHLSGHCQVYC